MTARQKARIVLDGIVAAVLIVAAMVAMSVVG